MIGTRSSDTASSVQRGEGRPPIPSAGPRLGAAALTLSAALVAASLASPAPAVAQEEEMAEQQQAQEQELPEGGTHEVVRGNTLWDLAARFYGDPYQWEVIYAANEESIVDPHWIYPGQILTIPGLEGEPDREVMVARAGPDRARGSGVEGRTVFYSATGSETGGTRVRGLPLTERFALSPDVYYAAPWLQPEGTEAESIGWVAGFTGAEQIRSNLQTAKPFDRLRVRIEGPKPRVGALLQTFRVTRDIHELGDVVSPTGLLTVAKVDEAGVVGVVNQEFARLRIGDRVRVAPRFPLEMGVHPREVEPTGPAATIVEFAAEHQLYNKGDVAFIDMGWSDGVVVGDEYVVIADHGEGWSGEVEGRVQVVSVQEDHASARIADLKNPVFRVGVDLHPFRKIR